MSQSPTSRAARLRGMIGTDAGEEVEFEMESSPDRRHTSTRNPIELTFRAIDLSSERDLVIASAQRRDSFVASFGSDGAFDEDKYLRYLARLVGRLPNAVSFALIGEEVAGQVEAQVLPDGTGYVNLYYLAPGLRGLGLGEQLHRYVVALLRGQGVTTAELAVSPTNARALSFYEKHGYRTLGLRPDGEPPVLEMRLELTGPTTPSTSA